MRRFWVATLFVLAFPSFGTAAPCPLSGTLDTYTALGSTGCELGSTTLADFSSAPSLFGGDEIPDTSVLVTLSDLPAGPELAFSLTGSAGPGELLGILIGYSVSGLQFVGASLSMTGSAAAPAADPFSTGGVVTVVEDICLNGDFDPFLLCSGTPLSLVAVHDENGAFPVDGVAFAPTSFFDVFVDITIDGGEGGTASLDGVVTNRFASRRAVPEPAALLLLGAGLLGACGRRWRPIDAPPAQRTATSRR